MLGNENKFSFHLLYQNFALSLNKISCISTKKINRNLFCFVFDLHYLCIWNVLMKQVKCRVGKIRYHGVDWI